MMTPANIFSIISIFFVSFLILVVVYESFITKDLPSDNPEKLQNISSKYGPDFNIYIPEASGLSALAIPDDEEDNDEREKHDSGMYEEHDLTYEFVKCPNDSNTYPTGTECINDRIKEEEQDDDDDDEDEKDKNDRDLKEDHKQND